MVQADLPLNVTEEEKESKSAHKLPALGIRSSINTDGKDFHLC